MTQEGMLALRPIPRHIRLCDPAFTTAEPPSPQVLSCA